MTSSFCQNENSVAATCHVAAAGVELASAEIDFAALHRQLSHIATAGPYAELTERLRPLCATTSVRFVVLCENSPGECADTSVYTLFGDRDECLSACQETILDIAQHATSENRAQVLEASVADSVRFVAWSVPGQSASAGDKTARCLIAAFDQGLSIPQGTLFTLQAATLQIVAWRVAQDAVERENAAQHLAALIELLSRLKTTSTVPDACRLLANELQTYLGCQQVVVGLCRQGTRKCHVEAISGVDAFHSHNEEVRTAQAALQEAITRGDLSMWPPQDETSRFGLKAHERFATAIDAEVVVGSALPDEQGEIRGAWLVAGSAAVVSQNEVLGLLCAARSPVASTLGLLERAHSGWVRTFSSSLKTLLRRRRGYAILATAVLTVATLFVPVPHRVKCDCQLEPVTRRFVAAPFAGPLQEALVEPGDFVKKGQILARMDGRDVRWELAGVQADLYRAAKERAGHVASHEAGAAVVARHEFDRLQFREQLLKARDQDLEIRSTVDGMVVSGDRKEAEGMPLKVGEVLFEIAPLDVMIVELAVPEDDLKFTQTGMPVHITFDAFPFRPYKARVEYIHPRAEIRDEQNVFIAEVRLDNPRQALHPGMRGHARIDAGKARIGWILSRRPLAAALEWLGW